MNILNETAEEVLKHLLENVGPKARTSLQRIKDACDEIEELGGVMNFSRVAAVTTKRTGGPRAQTIQNSKQLKAYISVRMREYQTRKRGRSRPLNSVRKTDADRSPYPAEGLDAKTKLFIDCMMQENQRLDTENKKLAELLEGTTRQHPISLADALGRGASETLGLDVSLADAALEMPDSLTNALVTVFSGTISHFEVQSRKQATCLVYELDGIAHTLLSPAQWKAAKDWLESMHDGR